MKRLAIAAGALALVSAIAWAASPSPLGGSNTSRGNLERIPDYNTIQNQAWYVDPAGSDTGNTCLSPSSPCQTIQRVLTLISAKHLRHQQAIYAAAGGYPCVIISGYQTDKDFNVGPAVPPGPIQNASGAGIAIRGTMVLASLDAGSATGTITSSIAGVIGTGITFTQITDNTQSWVPGQLKGHFVTFANFTRLVIYGNDAGTMTVVNNGAAPANGTSYRIEDPGSFFTSSCTVASSAGGNPDGGFATPIPNQGAFIVEDTTSGSSLSNYSLEQFAFRNDAGIDVNLSTPAGVRLIDVQLQNVHQANRVFVNYGTVNFTCARCAVSQPPNLSTDNMLFLNQNKTGNVSISQSLFESGRSAVAVLGGPRFIFQVNAMWHPQNFGLQLRYGDNQILAFLMEGNDTGITAGIRIGDTDGTNYAQGQTRVASTTMRYAGIGGGAFIDTNGAGVLTVTNSIFTSDAGLPSDPSTPAFRVFRGAGVEVDGNTIVSMPSANDVEFLEGSNGTLNFQLTGIRASVPACVSDSIGNWFCSP